MNLGFIKISYGDKGIEILREENILSDLST